jgi:nucleotide-binding universal stress UspA family protein
MKVLIATDGSEAATAACRMAARILQQDRDEVRLLTVLSYHLYPGSLVPGEHTPGEREAAARVRDEVERATHDGRVVLEQAGFDPTVAHRFGNPTDEIVADAEEWQPDLIVLGRRGVGGLERLLGSVSEHVVRHLKKTAVILVP